MNEAIPSGSEPATVQKVLQQLQRSYLAELPARIDGMERLALSLEDGAARHEGYAELYREAHSLKGSAGTFGYAIIGNICHQMEDFLSSIEPKLDAFSRKDADTLLCFIDLTRLAVGAITETNRTDGANVENEIEIIEEQLAALKSNIFKAERFGVIVEASRTNILLYQKVLEGLPISFFIENDGYQGLGRLLRERHELLITSVEVGPLSGVALISAVKASQRLNRETKTILLTSNANLQVAEAVKPDAVILKNADLPANLRAAAERIVT